VDSLQNITNQKRQKEKLNANQVPKQSLTLQELLSTISRKFLSLPPDRIHEYIEEAVQVIANTMNLDRSVLARFSDTEGIMRISTEYEGKSIPKLPADTEKEIPWIQARARAGKILRYSNLAELPNEAAKDKAWLTKLDIQSMVIVPVEVEGVCIGALTFEMIKRSRTWSDSEVQHCVMLADVFGNALARMKSYNLLEEELKFERLAAEISADFVDIPLEDIDKYIYNSLQRIGEHFNADRIALTTLTTEGKIIRVPHIWFSNYCDIDKLKSLTVNKNYADIVSYLKQHGFVTFGKVNEYPLIFLIDESDYLRNTGIKAAIVVKLNVAGNNVDIFTIDVMRSERIWPEDIVERVRFLGRVISNAARRAVAEQVERDNRQLREEIVHVTRVSSVGELSVALAHEINQPLAAIMSNAQAAQRFLKNEKPDINEIRDILKDIVDDNKRASDIIHKTRGLLKKSDYEFKKLDVNDIVQDILSLMRSDIIIRNVIIKADYDKSISPISGDRVHLQQVILNIITNALDAMDKVEKKELYISTIQKGPSTVTVRIQDSGQGIEENNKKSMFKPFFSTKKEGLGMGLSVCRTIILEHDGQIGVENNADKGATFYFSLPVCD